MKLYTKQTYELTSPTGEKRIIRCFEITSVPDEFAACPTFRAGLAAGKITLIESRQEESKTEQQPEKEYARMTVAELEKLAEKRGVDLEGCKKKAEILARLTGEIFDEERDGESLGPEEQ